MHLFALLFFFFIHLHSIMSWFEWFSPNKQFHFILSSSFNMICLWAGLNVRHSKNITNNRTSTHQHTNRTHKKQQKYKCMLPTERRSFFFLIHEIIPVSIIIYCFVEKLQSTLMNGFHFVLCLFFGSNCFNSKSCSQCLSTWIKKNTRHLNIHGIKVCNYIAVE